MDIPGKELDHDESRFQDNYASISRKFEFLKKQETERTKVFGSNHWRREVIWHPAVTQPSNFTAKLKGPNRPGKKGRRNLVMGRLDPNGRRFDRAKEALEFGPAE